jgi:hypothetical protein
MLSAPNRKEDFMFAPMPSHRPAHFLCTAAMCALIATTVASQQASAQVAQLAPATSVKKVVNGKFAAEVDSGWVIYQGFQGQPTLNFFDTDTNGSFKLKTNGFGASGAGLFFDAGGIVFAPCPVAAAPVRCQLNSDTGQSGVGVGFGQATFGGAGGEAGGWVNDSAFVAHLTNPNQNTGSIAAVAADSVNGAYAVGWDLNTTTHTNHAVVLKLDSAGKTYAPVSKTDLGTLGGSTSSVLAISKNAKYIAGMANNASNKAHAVFALTTATSWTDISTGFPAGVIKSRAFAVSNDGYVAGTAAVKRLVAGTTKTIDIGFVFNTADSTVKFFEAPGFNVKPLKVLAGTGGKVVGNLELSALGTIKANHPFLFDGTNLVDFGTMTIGGQPAFGCRVNRPNNLGELAGSCIPNNTTPYGVGGNAFYIDAVGASPAFVDVNAAIHANSDANTPGLAPYKMGSVTSIDDADEITVMGVKFVASTPNLAAFLIAKPSYNP